MSNQEVWVFKGGDCARCQSLNGEHPKKIGKVHPNCDCENYMKYSGQSERTECLAVMTTELHRELVHTEYTTVAWYQNGSPMTIHVLEFYLVVTQVVMDCSRVDAVTGRELESEEVVTQEHWEDTREYMIDAEGGDLNLEPIPGGDNDGSDLELEPVPF